jgi:formylglycine-generating enzyme required for sulfatase activity
MRMVLISSGRFRMGSPPGEPLRQEEERPHGVTLTRAFRLSATEVTQKQWLALMPLNPSPQKGDDLPVTSVSWLDAREFCRRLSEKEGMTYRLPTEAEWEYACRAESPARADTPGLPAPSGSPDPPATSNGRDSNASSRSEIPLDEVAWYVDNSNGVPHPVARKAPNGWGLYDMLGNVAEWTLDAYAPYPVVPASGSGSGSGSASDESPIFDPTGPETGITKVVRGGAYRSFPPALRCAARTGVPESYQLPHVGFRVVQEVGP